MNVNSHNCPIAVSSLSLSLFFHSLSAVLYSLVPLSPSLPLHLSSLSLSSYAVSLWGGCRKSGRKEQWKAGLKLIALPVACLVTKMCVWIGGSKLFVRSVYSSPSSPHFLSLSLSVIQGYHPHLSTRPDYKRTGQPVNITNFVKTSPTEINEVTIFWAPDFMLPLVYTYTRNAHTHILPCACQPTSNPHPEMVS